MKKILLIPLISICFITIAIANHNNEKIKFSKKFLSRPSTCQECHIEFSIK